MLTAKITIRFSPPQQARRLCGGTSVAAVLRLPAIRQELRGFLHGLRHFFCSFLINQGLDAVAVSRQAGHASPAVTMSIYAHEFGKQEKAQQARDALELAFGDSLDVTGLSQSDSASLRGIS